VLDAGMFFMRVVGAPHNPGEGVKGDIATITKLIPNRKVVESFGTIFVLTDDNPPKYRQLRPNESVPRDAGVVITNPRLAKQKATEYAESFLKSLAVIDGIFPHSPEWAAYFVQWYDMLASTASEPETRQRFAIEYLNWAEAAVKRSPEQALFREWYGKALWLRGNVETGAGRKSYFERGLDEYRKATELYPTSQYLWHRYGEALIKYGEALNSGQNKTAGDSFISQGKDAQRRASELQKAKGLA
jgi:hypothetical protein